MSLTGSNQNLHKCSGNDQLQAYYVGVSSQKFCEVAAEHGGFDGKNGHGWPCGFIPLHYRNYGLGWFTVVGGLGEFRGMDWDGSQKSSASQ